MKKVRLFWKMSVQYWNHHRKRFFTYILFLMLGAMSISSAALLLRSEKEALLEEELRILGDYDAVLYDISEEFSEEIKAQDAVSNQGIYYNLGTVENEVGASVRAAAFADTASEELYHMTCTKGNYPTEEGQIAIDLSTAKQLGVRPYPGEKITLRLYSDEGEELTEQEYTISGIFEASDESVWGGWLRYPSGLEVGAYDMPGVFFYKEANQIFQSDCVTMFLQSDSVSALSDMLSAYMGSELEAWQYEIPSGRSYAYSYVLGITDVIWETYGDCSISSVLQAMKNGDGIKDFYSAVLMPIFMLLTALIVIVSVMKLTENMIQDRQESFAILRSLGLQRGELIACLLGDFTATATLGVGLGIAAGSLLHIGMIRMLTWLCGLRLTYGFSCSEYVREVTMNPYAAAVITLFLCVELAVASACMRFIGKTPIQMFAERPKWTAVRRTRRLKKMPTSWKSLLSERFNLYDGSIMVVTIVVMSAALFGYTYFYTLAEKNTAELQAEREAYGLDDWDYKAQKDSNVAMAIFNIENHHDYGIRQERYEAFRQQEGIKHTFARAVNRSTRLVYEAGELSDDEQEALAAMNLRSYEDIDETDAYETALQEAENAVIETIGYTQTEQIYSLPTIGLLEDAWSDLEAYVAEGEINVEAIDAGEEIVLAVSEADWEQYSDWFHAGDMLPLSDIVLDAREETMSFYDITSETPVYRKEIVTPEGAEVPLTAYAWGTRRDIPVKIGAIVVLDEEAEERYMAADGMETCALYALCSMSAFSAWGLRDTLLTEVYAELEDGVSAEKLDTVWYEMLEGAQGLTTASLTEITSSMASGKQKIMCIYDSMIGLLVIMAAVTIAISLYTDIRLKSSQIAVLRSCGMSISQIFYLLVRQTLLYPIVGVICSIIPVALCQSFFLYIRRMVDSGVWDSISTGGIAWYHAIPFRYNLFHGHAFAAMLIIFAAYLLLLLAVTLPQLRVMRRQLIAEEIERSNF